MKGIFKNINADIITLHPRKRNTPTKSYIEAGLVPEQVVRIDMDEVKELLRQYEGESVDEYLSSIASDYQRKECMGIERDVWREYLNLRNNSLKRWVDEYGHKKYIYCMLKRSDLTITNGSACTGCVLTKICQYHYFPVCRAARNPCIKYSLMD